MKQICVVIPVHTACPSAYELISLRQCYSVLGNYPIRIVAPKGLSLIKYQEVVPNLQAVFIDPHWQSTLIGYNKLKVSRFFYDLFKNYEYLLTYELDAFVFRDDLAYWFTKEYDYVGAPWFVGFNNPQPNAAFYGVGNSGFSLRRVGPARRALKSIFYRNPAEYQSGRKNLLKVFAKTPYRWLRNQLGTENYTIQNNCTLYEDRFFSEVIPAYVPDFKVAPVEEALKFSFEVKPDYLFELNHQQLPMGCHAWWRYNLEFWRPFISSFGYTL